MDSSINKVLQAVQSEFPPARRPVSGSGSVSTNSPTPLSPSATATTNATANANVTSSSRLKDNSNTLSTSPTWPIQGPGSRQSQQKPSFIALPRSATFESAHNQKDMKSENLLLTPSRDDLPFAMKKNSKDSQPSLNATAVGGWR
ncbi:MAG: hypothetical protein CYPHOPRED_000927 [Cyphobasidiales sp. Tagirdzhanova-0007]|nr:MAG: hypothetical protein CYPHOPRED_000927 [Cyphobasidiales sp. Tagirdzhanova-0007]